MLELIIALLLSLGVITNADQITDNHIQEYQDQVRTHIIDDDLDIQ